MTNEEYKTALAQTSRLGNGSINLGNGSINILSQEGYPWVWGEPFSPMPAPPLTYAYWWSSTSSSPGVLSSPGALPEAKRVVEVVEAPSREMLKRVAVDTDGLDLSDARQKLATEAEALLGYTPLRTELHMPGRLRQVLAKLEIATLEEKSVIAYKAQMVKHYSTSGKMTDPTWRITPLNTYGQAVPEFVLQKAIEIRRELPEAIFYVEQLAADPFLIVSLKPLSDYLSAGRTLQRQMDFESSAYVEVWSEPKFEAEM